MWIQDIERAIDALKMQVNPDMTLIERINSNGPFITFTTTYGTKYFYDARYGTIQAKDEQ